LCRIYIAYKNNIYAIGNLKFVESKNEEVYKEIDSCKKINIFARKIWKHRAGGRENKGYK